MENEKELIVCGMSRSGNHAIINWILRQASGRHCFLNCAEGKTNPFDSCRPLDDGLPWSVNYSDFSIERERAGLFSKKDLLVHSYEDAFLGYVFNRHLRRDHDRLVGRSRRRFDLLILRDPFNLFASRRALGDPLSARAGIRMWKQHAREFLGLRRHLEHNKLAISYNRWSACRDYRRSVAEHLDLPFTDAGVDAVARCAGGSSFDGLRLDGRAGRMPVAHRWRRFAADPGYWALFDDELVALARRIFGPLEAMEHARPPRRWIAALPAAPAPAAGA